HPALRVDRDLTALGAEVVLAGDAVVVGVEPLRIAGARLERSLGVGLGGEVAAVPVAAGSAGPDLVAAAAGVAVALVAVAVVVCVVVCAVVVPAVFGLLVGVVVLRGRGCGPEGGVGRHGTGG